MKRLTWIMIVVMAVIGAVNAQELESLKTFYFGNSFLENSMVGLHGPLGQSAGKEWDLLGALIHPGVPIWVHAVRQTEPDSSNYKKFSQHGAETEAIVMLLFGGQGLSSMMTEMWEGKYKFDEPRDLGDVASCATIIERYLEMNPNGKAYVYQAWPYNPAAREFLKRVQEESRADFQKQGLDRGEIMKKVKKIELSEEQMEKVRREMDYPKIWLAEDYIPDAIHEDHRARYRAYSGAIRTIRRKDANASVTLAMLAEEAGVTPDVVKEDLAIIRITEADLADPEIGERIGRYVFGCPYSHSRPHTWAVAEGLKEKFPDLWKEKRLGMIPVGDVFFALDKKMKAGEVPGLVNVGQFSADGGHIRSGLPRYTVAATFFAVMFKAHPKALDWNIYGNRDNYISKAPDGLNKVGGHYVHIPDLGTHLEITEERAQIVNDTIWEVVTDHPYTWVEKK